MVMKYHITGTYYGGMECGRVPESTLQWIECGRVPEGTLQWIECGHMPESTLQWDGVWPHA